MGSVTQADLDNCAAEPIRVPGGIQPHGAMLVLDADDLSLLQVSRGAAEMLGIALYCGETPALPEPVLDWATGTVPNLLKSISLPNGRFEVSGHRTTQGIIVEFEVGGFEPVDLENIYPAIQTFADAISALETLASVGSSLVEHVRALTGFDRSIMYEFDPEWHGSVLAENSNGELPSYLGLRFPASDIPAQARELYRMNPLRIIPDADYELVPLEPPINPRNGAPLDMSFAALRSVSPVHLQYMRNMGTYSSMSVSVIVDDRLWGLITCHSAGPRRVGPQVRTACNLLAKIASLRIASIERGAHAAQRIAYKQRETELVAHLSRSETIAEGLLERPEAWFGVTDADGAAIITATDVHAAGLTPDRKDIARLADWLDSKNLDTVYATDRLGIEWPEAASMADRASGIIAVPISQVHTSYVIWFRREVVQTVRWGGEPQKSVEPSGSLTPRTSFAQWQEQLRLRSVPWGSAAVESGNDFRSAVINFVLRQAEERAVLTEELQRTNKELESFSYSISHDLRAPFRHIVGYSELLNVHNKSLDDKSRHYIRNISDAALSASRLVDDLLNFSRLGRSSLSKSRVDVNKLVHEVIRSQEVDTANRQIEWNIGSLPPAFADPALFRQAVSNMIENAVKYSRDRKPAVVEISGTDLGKYTSYTIRDNGVGFEMAYASKLFGVFQRLHRTEEFTGTGIGLALTKRIIERHRGTVTAEGEVGKGAAFTVTLPTGEENG